MPRLKADIRVLDRIVRFRVAHFQAVSKLLEATWLDRPTLVGSPKSGRICDYDMKKKLICRGNCSLVYGECFVSDVTHFKKVRPEKITAGNDERNPIRPKSGQAPGSSASVHEKVCNLQLKFASGQPSLNLSVSGRRGRRILPPPCPPPGSNKSSYLWPPAPLLTSSALLLRGRALCWRVDHSRWCVRAPAAATCTISSRRYDWLKYKK